MNLDQFVDTTLGQFVHFDEVWGAQCMDLVRVYIRDVLGDQYQPPLVRNAYSVWNNYPKEHYERIKNTKYNFPLPGDIIIWHYVYGGTGHIAIVLDADVNSFTVLSQNDPRGKPTIKKTYKYNWMVLGWLHPIK